jgi:putative flippase GtrA
MRLRRIAATGFRFLVVGGLSTLIEIGVFNLVYLVVGWDPVVAKIVASLVALVNAYFGNRQWTFRARGRGRKSRELVLFIATNVVCAILGAIIVGVGTAAFGDHDALVVNAINLVSIVVVVLVRFVLYYKVVFRHVPPLAEETPQEQSAP